jgi:hypothetical protein
MKKKIIVLAAALMAISVSGAFAFGIGLQANANAGSVFEPGVALTFKVDSLPVYFAANWSLGEEAQSFGLTGDYWILNDKITNLGSAPLKWFVGVGLFLNMGFAKDSDMTINSGLRIPVGLNMAIAKGVFEPYIQIAPSFGGQLIPSLGAGDLFLPLSAGFRIWFK